MQTKFFMFSLSVKSKSAYIIENFFIKKKLHHWNSLDEQDTEKRNPGVILAFKSQEKHNEPAVFLDKPYITQSFMIYVSV